jgi:5'-nucleotidase
MRFHHMSIAVLVLAVLQACSTAPEAFTGNKEITVLAINDFHGNLQADKPVPYLHPGHDAEHPEKPLLQPAGGYAYLATEVKRLRQQSPDSILVGAGDLIGASPLGSSLLKDEPVIEAMNQLGLDVSSLGNHEFDGGKDVLLKKIHGECGAQGCAYAGFSGAKYTYLAANVIDESTGKPWVQPYVIRTVGGMKIAFIGAVTKDTPNIVAGNATGGLKFEDEAVAINRYIPEIRQQGVAAIIVLIHEGAMYAGDANDPSYRCEGLNGPIIDIAKRIDPAVDVIVSAHTHQGYTCKIDGRLVTQARSYGAYITEIKLNIDRASNRVVAASAVNHLIDQSKLEMDAQAKKLVEQMSAQTDAIRSRLVTILPAPLTRKTHAPYADSALGNAVADAQLSYVQQTAQADIAFMNAGGIRAEFNNANAQTALKLTYADVYAVQPFRNNLVSMEMTGAQVLAVLQQQFHGGDSPHLMSVSKGFSYDWRIAANGSGQLENVKLNGQAIDAAKTYRIVANAFLADGGDGFTVFKQAKNRQLHGLDVDAFETYLHQQGANVLSIDMQRIRHLD